MYFFIRVILQGMITHLFFEAIFGIDDLFLIFMLSRTILSKILYNDLGINCMMKKREAIKDKGNCHVLNNSGAGASSTAPYLFEKEEQEKRGTETWYLFEKE